VRSSKVAFNQGAEPRRGYELILDHYGTCSAITAFDHLPQDEAVRAACAERLVGRLHEDLVASLRAEIVQRGQPLPAEGAPIAELIDNRPWLFADDAYHIDISHLGAVVRLSPLVRDRAARARAVELTDYGRHLSDRHRAQGEPPFENHYEDHSIYLRALQGDDVDAAVEHFRAKLVPPPPRATASLAMLLARGTGSAWATAWSVRNRRRSWSISCSVWTGSTKRSRWPTNTSPEFPTRRSVARAWPSFASAAASPTAWPGSPARKAISSTTSRPSSRPNPAPRSLLESVVDRR